MKISILAATKMEGAICVAGVDSNDRWVRPVPKDGHNFQASQLMDAERVVVEPFNEVEFTVTRVLTNSPQSEDLEVDATRGVRLVRVVPETEATELLRRLDEHELVSSHGDRRDLSAHQLETFMISKNRSLVLARVDKVSGVTTRYFREQGKYRIQFSVGRADFDLPCTDLRWRALARTRGSQAASQLQTAREVHFVLGLTRVFKDRHWPMVIGVHPKPRLIVNVDYGDL